MIVPLLPIPRCCCQVREMSALEKVNYSELKKRLSELIDLDDWTNECATCGSFDLIHKGACTRDSKDLPEELIQIRTKNKKRMRSHMRWSKSDRASEREKDSLLDGLKKFMFDITDQNSKNIETVVTSLKTDGVKDDSWSCHRYMYSQDCQTHQSTIKDKRFES